MSRSARRKSVKALDLARKQVRRDGAVYRNQVKRDFDAWMEHHRKELRKLREVFAPTLERLLAIRIGLPFRVGPVSFMSHLAASQDHIPATSMAFETVDTTRLMRACIDIPVEVLLFTFGRDVSIWLAAEQELKHAAGVLVSKLMADAWASRQNRA